MPRIHSQNKGKRFEREVAELLRDNGYEARRGFQARGGAEQPDVVTNFPFHCECKHVESLNLWKAYEQSTRDAAPGLEPVVVFKKNNKRALVCIDFESFVKYMKETIK
jgi:hypothetical protein